MKLRALARRLDGLMLVIPESNNVVQYGGFERNGLRVDG